MIYLLDTNILSAVINNDTVVLGKINSAFAEGHQLGISAITYFEIRRGLERPKHTLKDERFRRWVTQLILFHLELSTFDTAARIWQQLRAKGNLLEDAWHRRVLEESWGEESVKTTIDDLRNRFR